MVLKVIVEMFFYLNLSSGREDATNHEGALFEDFKGIKTKIKALQSKQRSQKVGGMELLRNCTYFSLQEKNGCCLKFRFQTGEEGERKDGKQNRFRSKSQAVGSVPGFVRCMQFL